VYDFRDQCLVTVLPEDDTRIQAVSQAPGRVLTKWLQETRNAVKGGELQTTS